MAQENTYPHQRLYRAIRCLVGSGELRSRIENASNEIHGLDLTSLPSARSDQWNAIIAKLTAVDGPDGSIRATVESMSTDQAAEIALEIFDLYVEVRGGI